MDDVYDVAVIGYGPTGMAAASLLGRLGHRVLVCERWPSLYGLPRFTHIDDETARAVQACGDVAAALADSTPVEYRWVNGADEELLHLPATVGTMGYPTHISMYQPDVEDAVDARVRSLPAVDVRQGWSVTALTQTAEHVELDLERWKAAGPGSQQSVRARYVIASDGSKSAVRELLGIGREDHGFNERWLNFDTEWLTAPPAEYGVSKQYCDPARGHMYMGIGRSRQRFEFALLPGEATSDFEHPDKVWELLRDAHGLGPDDVRVIRQIVYTFESRVAQQWRDRRVLLAGDAAHTMPPYLGQGACSGIRDATNLAWKLDLVLRGEAPDDLLDTYEQERRPHATALVHMSVGLGGVANTHDPAAAAHRDEAFRTGSAPPPPAMPPLLSGVLRPGQGPEQGVGGLVPQGRVSTGAVTGLLDDVVGPGFVLVTTADPAVVLGEEAAAVLRRLGCRVVHLGADVVDLDGVHTRYLDELGACAYLARPDFVLFGTASSPADVEALVLDLRAAVSAPSAAAVLS
ncbi:bifunctional 3-(3-hydroxy-phenyl)propionate/3-hydroxycinnamic acid hydroxylase [Modestobacter sp. Leaf380]|uniref:bifunctional 3-(3-hydroxy-phenyl)propionate/3-hydroxycinnamic acid hydroxylase MhpA n=1 Tax=Modestobacter sp. Leaf380 TaxID=1736356 RepID=UPI000A55524E|nr:bifunctional 3-(3-hydroxy-phenyl)propionate/3-hydroxycinnamic acid hydroxylase [Modestobacter sp. Leaf380]